MVYLLNCIQIDICNHIYIYMVWARNGVSLFCCSLRQDTHQNHPPQKKSQKCLVKAASQNIPEVPTRTNLDKKWVPNSPASTASPINWAFPTFRPFSSILEPRSTHRAAACVKCRPAKKKRPPNNDPKNDVFLR